MRQIALIITLFLSGCHYTGQTYDWNCFSPVGPMPVQSREMAAMRRDLNTHQRHLLSYRDTSLCQQ